MFDDIFIHATDNNERIKKLELSLSSFYGHNDQYYEIASEGNKRFIYESLVDLLRKRVAERGKRLKVLELGAGRTSFPEFVRQAAPSLAIDFVAHDINDSNVPYYKLHNIQHIIGDWRTLLRPESFDFCFSTFVFEHLTAPHSFVETMARTVTKDGAFIVICPKYVMPGYVPPALRWLPTWRKHLLTSFLAISNIFTVFLRRPKFLICVQPSFLKLPFRRDYDAVHMVAPADLRSALGPGFHMRRFPLRRRTWKERLLDKLILLSIIVERKGVPT